MPPKQHTYRSYGEKIISLFVRLLFTREEYSLTRLAELLQCSKQTVLRLLEDLRRAYRIELEERYDGNRKYVRLHRPERRPLPQTLSEMEFNLLLMCRDFTAHLLGDELFQESTRALEKSQALLSGDGTRSDRHFAVFRPGTIDYTPHQATIKTLIQAMEEGRIVKLEYKPLEQPRARTRYIKPFKIFSHRETMYLHGRLARDPGKRGPAPDIEPLLAVHRIEAAALTDRRFEFPKDYDFEAAFNRHFGVIKQKSFEVEAEFYDWAAEYASERIWSPDQQLTRIAPNAIRIIFTASSEWEVLSWILSFREDAKLFRPAKLVEEIRKTVDCLRRVY